MFSCLSAWVVATLISQAQVDARASLLTKVPADAEVVISLKSLDDTQTELVAMLRGFSRNLAQQAEPAITASLQQFVERFGKELADVPVVVAGMLPEPGAGEPTMAIVLPLADYDGFLKTLGEGTAPTLESENGVDHFKLADGQTLYSCKGDGFIAFGPTRDGMVRAIASKPAATFGERSARELTEALTSGDAGLYVSMAAIQKRYGDQIANAREQLMAIMDQAGAQAAQNKGQLEQAKVIYGKMFDAIQEADGLAVNFDFDEAALDLSGFLTLKSGSKWLAGLEKAQRTSAALLEQIPLGYLFYTYMNVDSSMSESAMKMSLGSMYPQGKGADSPEMQKYYELLKAQGSQETAMGMTMFSGFKIAAIQKPADAQKGLEAMLELNKALGKSENVKSADLEQNLETYRGISLNRVTTRFDIDALLGAQAGNPQVAGMLRSMFGPDATVTNYFGSDGKQIYSVTGGTIDEARKSIDSILDGTSTLGSAASYKSFRSRLPGEVTMLVVFQAQSVVKAFSSMLGSMLGGAAFPTPAGMPDEAALFGGAFGTYPTGFRFDFVVPTAVGPVFERGFGPLIQGLQGQVNQ